MAEKLTLQVILAKIDELDQAEVIDDQAAADIREALGEKVDAYKKVILYYEARASAIADEIDKLTKAKRQITATIERIENMLLFTMKAKGYTKRLPGDIYDAVIVRTNQLKVKRLPDEFDAIDFDGYVNVKLSWDLKRLKTAAKTDEKIAELFDEYQTESISFPVRKADK
jgi:ribosomal protein L14